MNDGGLKAGMNGMNGSVMPLFGFPRMALPGVTGKLAEQGVARAEQGCEKIKVVSVGMTEALHETYSSNARSATDYGPKVFSNINTASAVDFYSHLLGSKSVTDVFTLTVAQARKAFDTASARNKELWVRCLPRSSQRKQASPSRSTKAAKKRGGHFTSKVLQEGTGPVGTSPATSMAPHARLNKAQVRDAPQLIAPTRGAIQPAGLLFENNKTTFKGGSHGHGHGQMSGNRTRDPNGHED